MEKDQKTMITIQATVKAPLSKVWQFWTSPEHITQWNFADVSWHSPHAENDLQVGGKFSYRMEARDGSAGFDFWGIYTAIKEHERIESELGDGRKLSVSFSGSASETKIVESFEAESENSIELQKNGWQAILNNFKKHTEEN